MAEFKKKQWTHPLRGLGDLLQSWSTNNQYEIPVFQRNYIWEEKTVNTWLNDVYNVLSVKNYIHYMGTLVYSIKSGATITKRLVIDGQQRLTTLFLFFYAIRDILYDEGKDEDAKRLEKLYLINTAFEEDSQLKLKLKPLISDDNVFLHIINRDQLVDCQNSNVYKRFNQIKEYIKEHINEISIENIKERIDNIYVSIFEIPNEDNVQRVFESINATGKKLLDSDLIRNFILMQKTSSDEQEVLYNEYYKKIEENCDNNPNEILSFYRWYLSIKEYELISKKEIYNAFKEYYKERINENENVEIIIKEIKKYSLLYFELFNLPIDRIDKTIRDIIDEFRYINSEMPKPFIIEMYKLYKDNRVSDKTFNKLVEIIISYIMRRGLCELNTSNITRLFPKLLKDVLSDIEREGTNNIVDSLVFHLVNENQYGKMNMPTDDMLANALRTKNMYKNDYIKIAFTKIENNNNPIPVDTKPLTIEHLMPQDGSKWIHKLGISEKEYDSKNYVIGNLTFLSKSDNSKAKHNIFERKKEIFKNTSHLRMNMEIISKSEWNVKEIDERTNNLIKKLCELYEYKKSDRPLIDTIDLINETNCAIATLYPNDGSVTIKKGNIINNYTEWKEKICVKQKWQNIINDIESEDVSVIIKNRLEFVDDYTLIPKRSNSTALSTAARMFTTHSVNGWSFWKTEGGKSLSDDERLHKFTQRDEDIDLA